MASIQRESQQHGAENRDNDGPDAARLGGKEAKIKEPLAVVPEGRARRSIDSKICQ